MAKQYDEIGFWSELKLSIIRDYATEYSKILANQQAFATSILMASPDLECIYREELGSFSREVH